MSDTGSTWHSQELRFLVLCFFVGWGVAGKSGFLQASSLCHIIPFTVSRASLVVQWYSIHLPMQETQVRSLGQEDPDHSSILAWEITWTEKPSRLLGCPRDCKESARTKQLTDNKCNKPPHLSHKKIDFSPDSLWSCSNSRIPTGSSHCLGLL